MIRNLLTTILNKLKGFLLLFISKLEKKLDGSCKIVFHPFRSNPAWIQSKLNVWIEATRLSPLISWLPLCQSKFRTRWNGQMKSEGAMKRWKNREVRSISKSKSDRWLVSVLTRFARPANQPINLKGIFLWNWDIDLSISPLAGSGRGLGGNFNPRPTVHSIISLFRLSIENGRLATFLVELIS